MKFFTSAEDDLIKLVTIVIGEKDVAAATETPEVSATICSDSVKLLLSL